MIVHPNFDPVALSIGPLSIHWYGLMYLCGFAAGMVLGRYRARRSRAGWQEDEVVDLVFYIAVGIIAGGRLGYVLFYNLSFYLSSPLDIIAIWDGGMSFHGGLIGVIAALWCYARKTNRGILAVADFLAPLVAPGLFFGRIGNFVNQELWGRTTDLPWGVLFYTAPGSPRHPSQLYEALLEGLILFIIVWWYSSKERLPGRVCGLFLLGYGVFRFFVEFYRQPDGHIGAVALDWMTMGQVLSIPMILLGLFLLVRKRSIYSGTE
ncbi:prolipoprotein diacylglyceryl transferase [Candidatus Spongiihabitans sp.]|uniref:prolipoprotein diacylglyceryl transferase n=1 Tax=Candidatus Spongiihabitans sp. TaxID=3101308 RepID=UPI003C6F7806